MYDLKWIVSVPEVIGVFDVLRFYNKVSGGEYNLQGWNIGPRISLNVGLEK